MAILLVGSGGYAAIQDAVNAASNGDTIVVAAGTYNEVVTLNKDVTIQGPNAGVPGTDPRAAEAIVNGGFYISSAGAGATLDGLRLDNGANSVGGVPAGIHVSADNVTLTNMVFDGAGTAGMPAVTTPYNGGITGLTLSDSLVTGWAQGAYFNPTTQFTATGNSFDGNNNAILGDDWDDVTLIDNNSFTTNGTGSHIGYGVLDTTEDVGAFFGTGNTFNGANRPTSIFAYGDGSPGGQTIYGTEASNLITGQEFVAGSGNDATFHGRGGNDRLDGNSGNDTLNGGTGNDDLRGGAGTDIADYDNDRAEYTINGTTNSFGMVTGFTGVTDTTAGTGDEGTDTFTGIERIQFDDVLLDSTHPVQVFDSGGNLVGTYGSIQAAVAGSVDGQTIRVSAGTYNETVTVNKDVTIEGPNTGVAGTAVRSAEAIVNGGFYMSAAGATLDGLTVLNGAMPGGNSAGIFVNADDVTITNMILDGDGTVQRAGVTTTYNGGITGLELSDSLITGWHWGTYFNPTTGFTATGNSFDDNGNAILGDDWAAGTFIDGNSFTDSTGSHIGYGSFDTVEDMTTYIGRAGDLGEVGNTFDPDSRAVSIFAYGDGTPGGQTITGTDEANGIFASEFVAGSGTNSTFNGLGGNDYLYGGLSNDNLNGGTGTDTAAYDGPRGDYSIAFVTGAGGRIVGFSQVGDNNPGNGNEGVDALNSIEVLKFSDRTFDTTQKVQLFDFANQLLGTFDTIQAAIDMAQDNYTIRVAAGIYDEDLTIDVGVRILGARAGVAGTSGTRDAAGGANETTIIGRAHVTADDNVTLDGLRFLNDASTTNGGPSNPTLQFQTGGGATGHLLTSSIFWSTVAGGLRPSPDDRAISAPVIADGTINITNNLISGSSQGLFGTASWGRGIWFDGGGVNLNVTGNTIEWSRTGLNLDMTGTSAAFVDNNLLQNLGTGIAVGVEDDNLIITNNDVRNVGEEFNFRNLTVPVTFDAEDAVDALTTVGDANDLIVVLGGSGNDDISGTSFGDLLDGNQLVPANADADTLDGRGGNDILLGRAGDDTLIGGTGDDMLDGGDGADTLNGGADADTLSGGNGVDSLTGGSGNDSIDGGAGTDTAHVGTGATYVANGANWTVVSSEGTDTLVNVEIVDGAGAGPNTLLVGSGGFASIQAAVDAANDGDTILVATGTYFEQVVVDNLDNLTIEAAPGATVTIEAPANVVQTGTSSSGRAVNAVLTVVDSANVTIDNIDIKGAGHADTVDGPNANFVGVFYRNASGSLLDADVTGIRDPYPGGNAAGGEPLQSGNQRGVGVQVDNDTLMNFTMTGGSISDFQKNATVFRGADLDVTGVTITGGGAQTINAQNGIQATLSTGTISGNTITDIGYAGTQNLYSGAMLLFGNTGLDVQDNIIVGSNVDDADAKVVGIYVLDFGTPNSGGSITGNTISHVDEGIDVSGDVTPNGILIEDNSVTDIDLTDQYAAGLYFAPTPTLAVAHNVDGTEGSDIIAGGAGNDDFAGLGANDTLTGNGGDDTLDGGSGTDTAVYSGNQADYSFTYDQDVGGPVTSFASATDNEPGDGDDGDDTLTSIEVLQFGDATLDLSDPIQLFDENGDLVGTFTGIQAAVDAASDDYSILIAAGTYVGNVNVDKDLTILGANDGVSGSGTRGAESIIDGRVTISADGVTIDGVEIIGADAGPLGTTGVVVASGSDDFSIVNSVLSGSGDFALFVGLVTGLDVGDNLIEGYSIGMYIAGGGTSGSVHDNLFQGDGGPLTGLGNGVNSETSHVLIQDNTFDGIYYGSLNLYPFGPDTVDLLDYVINNTITDSGADRPIQILPTNGTHNILGTAENEAFDGETAALGGVTGAFSFDGRGGDDRAWGGGQGDTLTGGAGQDQLFGNGGDDTLTGGLDNDLLTGGAGIDTANFGGTLGFIDTVVGWAVTSTTDSSDFLDGVEIAIDGSGQHNLLVGSTAFGSIQAAMNAAGTNDIVRLAAGSHGGAVTYDDAGLSVIAQPGAVQNVTYSTTSGFGIQILAAGGADTITTGDGNDFIDGGAGVDTLAGRNGNDVYIVDHASDTVTELAGQGTDEIRTGLATYSIAAMANVEKLTGLSNGGQALTGNGGANVITGAAGNDTLNGGGGADTMSGFGGNDKYIVDDAGDIVIEAVGGGSDSVSTVVDYTLAVGSNVERLTSISWALTTPLKLTGNEIVNLIEGNAGDNVLDGRAGADTMVGFGGNDKYVVDNAGDVVTEGAGGGTDSISAVVDYTLAMGVHVERLNAISFALTTPLKLTGNEFVNLVEGNAGDNVLNGGGGADTLVGFGGNDKFVVDNSGDVVTELSGGGNDSISTVVDYTLAAGSHVERLNAISFALTTPLKLTGNEFANLIEGNAGDNTLDGKGGADTLVGFGGVDSFAFTSTLGGGNVDAITGFVAGTDKVALDDAIFAAVGAALDASELRIGAAAADADDRIVYNSGTGQLFYDSDGAGGAAQVQFATLSSGLALTVSDFTVI